FVVCDSWGGQEVREVEDAEEAKEVEHRHRASAIRGRGAGIFDCEMRAAKGELQIPAFVEKPLRRGRPAFAEKPRGALSDAVRVGGGGRRRGRICVPGGPSGAGSGGRPGGVRTGR